MNKIVLIDGSNLLHRSLRVPDIFQLSYNGVKTGGIHSFFRSLIRISDYFRDYPIILWDKGFSERRVKLFSNYKSKDDKVIQREQGLVEKSELEFLDEYRKQRSIINNILKMFTLPGLLISNTEADDMINFLVKRHSNDISFVLSEDSDFIQLLDYVDVFFPIKNTYCSNKEFSYEIINYSKLNKTQLKTLNDLDYDSTIHYLHSKAIKGDPSDNIQGVKGLGEVNGKKFAREILKNKDFIEELRQKPKRKGFEEKLVTGYNDYLLALELIDLNKEVFSEDKIKEIYATIKMAFMSKIDFVNLISIFSEYGRMNRMSEMQSYTQYIDSINSGINIFD